ncbi:hypothetical protein PMI01_03000 [Caulobacter sp. AP07]|uniref:hypothetical protein n=1 Tax=Caulobacter sp. AP07 TaxID=1144304 RepID=UPI000271E8CE|nr:hypothetical protein [Caulobacter sp. AP07]EJL30777.1 hypothetical protein PMI01_03000 [Caulobacter sp. AP07]
MPYFFSASLQQVQRVITERNERFERNYEARDAVAVVRDYFVEDVHRPLLCPPGRRPLKGRAELAVHFAAMLIAAPYIRFGLFQTAVLSDSVQETGELELIDHGGMRVVHQRTVLWRPINDQLRAQVSFLEAGPDRRAPIRLQS